MQKTLIICPHFPPVFSGLSDYTKTFIDQLKGHRLIHLATNQSKQRSDDDKEAQLSEHLTKIFEYRSWGFRTVYKLLRTINDENYDEVLIQYVPYMYGRAGINFVFPFFVPLVRLMNAKLKIQVMFHELYYPFEFKFKESIIHYSHRFMLIPLVYFSDYCFVSTEFLQKTLCHHFPLLRDRIGHLSVSSNINDEVNTNQELDKVDEQAFTVIHFGSFHPSKCAREVFNSFATEKTEGIFIRFIGVSKEEARSYFGDELFLKLAPFAVYLGKLTGPDVAYELMKAQLLLGFFIDGMTTRRGSLLAALRYGLPVLSTVTIRSDEILKKGPLYFTTTKPEVFIRRLIELTKDPLIRSGAEREKIKSYFNEFFSWDKMIESYLRGSTRIER